MADDAVLVTGANGFIGSHVVERFLAAGRHVRGLVREGSDRSLLRDRPVEWCVGDVTDRSSLDRAVRGASLVVHVAGLASDWGPWERFRSVNVEGTVRAAEAAADAGVARFVHVSTAAVHGFAGARDMTETSPTPPSPFPYVESKRLAEERLRDVARRRPLPVATVRPGNVFGPRDHTFVRRYADAMRDGKVAYVAGGRSLTCLTYVGNLADAIHLAAVHPAAPGECFLVTDGLEIDWRTFTEALADAAALPRPRLSVPYPVAWCAAAAMEAAWRLARSPTPPLLTRYRIGNAGRDYHFSIGKIRRVLGFVPAVGLDEALRRTAEWLHPAS